jgi:AcrR family transcriptional regulator
VKTDSGDRAARTPLSRNRVLQGALAIADAGGLESLTIRSLAHELGVKPMSVYHYVANKSEIIDGIVDQVFSEIELPALDGDWRTETHRRAASARAVLRRHSWAIPLLQSRTHPGPATLRHHDAVIGALRYARTRPAPTGIPSTIAGPADTRSHRHPGACPLGPCVEDADVRGHTRMSRRSAVPPVPLVGRQRIPR